MKRALVLTVSAGLLLGGCATGSGNKEGIGALLGGVAGAAAGSEIGGHGTGKIVGIAGGAILGAMAGSAIGKALDEHDRLMLAQAQQQSFEYSRSGERTTWQNPDSGHSGYVVPKPAYQNDNGQYCREYTQEITVGGKTEEGYGTACRQPDGSWKIVS
jgi:surface antigen